MSLVTINLAAGVYLDCVLFPLSFTELLDTIEKNGYVLNPTLPVNRALSRFRGSGQIGSKGKNTFQVDAGEKSIIIIGVSFEEVQSEFDAFSKTLLEDYSIDLDEMTKFYQLSANCEYKTKYDPYEVISKMYESSPAEKASELLGLPVKTFSIRLASDALPRDIDWFDVKITPHIERNDSYIIEIVYRNEDKEKYQSFTKDYELKIINFIKHIEA